MFIWILLAGVVTLVMYIIECSYRSIQEKERYKELAAKYPEHANQNIIFLEAWDAKEKSKRKAA